PARYADHRAVRRYVAVYHRVRTDSAVVADIHRADDLGAHADDYVVADGRMALHLLEVGAAERYLMIHQDVVADLGGFADDVAHPVVDEEPPPDLRARMNLDARDEAGDLRDVPRHQLPEPSRMEGRGPDAMGNPMRPDSLEPRISE